MPAPAKIITAAMLVACSPSSEHPYPNAYWQHGSGATAADAGRLVRVGHDGVDVDPALRRYAGMVTALGPADPEGRIYSFESKRLPAAPGYTINELRGWRLTMLAGKRFASVFEVESNTASAITVAARDGPLNGLAVNDVFVIEKIAPERSDARPPRVAVGI